MMSEKTLALIGIGVIMLALLVVLVILLKQSGASKKDPVKPKNRREKTSFISGKIKNLQKFLGKPLPKSVANLRQRVKRDNKPLVRTIKTWLSRKQG